jgi:hypothetical protein
MKSQSQIRHANQEKMIMMGLEHPNIVRLWYAFQTPSKMYAAPPPSPLSPSLFPFPRHQLFHRHILSCRFL